MAVDTNPDWRSIELVPFLARRMLKGLAPDIRPQLKELLEASASQKRARSLPATESIGKRMRTSYLIGSSARQTVVAPIDDIKIVYQFEPD